MATAFNESYYLKQKIAQLATLGQSYTEDSLKAAIEHAGMTVEQHYDKYATQEGTSANPYFNTTEYLEAKLAQLNSIQEGGHAWTMQMLMNALDAAGLTAEEHYQKWGCKETDANGKLINPSNAFDANAYVAAKLAQLQATDPEHWAGKSAMDVLNAITAHHMSPVSHYEKYGAKEANADGVAMVQTVPVVDRVANDPLRAMTDDNVPSNYNASTAAPASVSTGKEVTKPADMGGLADESVSPEVVSPEEPVATPSDPEYVEVPGNGIVDTNEQPVVLVEASVTDANGNEVKVAQYGVETTEGNVQPVTDKGVVDATATPIQTTATNAAGETVVTTNVSDGENTISETTTQRDGGSTTTTQAELADGSTVAGTTETAIGANGVETSTIAQTVTNPDGSTVETAATETKAGTTTTTESTITAKDKDGNVTGSTESTVRETANANGSTTVATNAEVKDANGNTVETISETATTVKASDGSTTTTTRGTSTDANGNVTTTNETVTANRDAATGATTTDTAAKTTNPDGSTVETASSETAAKAADGTVTTAKSETVTATDASGNASVTQTESTKVENPDGSGTETSTVTATAADGSTVETKSEATTTVAEDGTKTTESTTEAVAKDASGETTSTTTTEAKTTESTDGTVKTESTATTENADGTKEEVKTSETTNADGSSEKTTETKTTDADGNTETKTETETTDSEGNTSGDSSSGGSDSGSGSSDSSDSSSTTAGLKVVEGEGGAISFTGSGSAKMELTEDGGTVTITGKATELENAVATINTKGVAGLELSGVGNVSGGVAITGDSKTSINIALTTGSGDEITLSGKTKSVTVTVDGTESKFEDGDSIAYEEGTFNLANGNVKLTAVNGTLDRAATGSVSFTGSESGDGASIAGKLSVLGEDVAAMTVSGANADLELDSGASSITSISLEGDANKLNVTGNSGTFTTFELGSGDNAVTIASGATLTAPASLTLGDGNDEITVASGGTLTAVKTIDLGDGANKLTIASGATAADITGVTGGSGDDTIDLSGLAKNASGGVTVTTGGGKDTITLSADKNITYTVDLTGGASGSTINGVKTGTILKAGANWTLSETAITDESAAGAYTFSNGTLTWMSDSGIQTATLNSQIAFFSGDTSSLHVTLPGETDLLVNQAGALSMVKASSDNLTVDLTNADPYATVTGKDGATILSVSGDAVSSIDTTNHTGTMTITGLANGDSDGVGITRGSGDLAVDVSGAKSVVTIVNGSTESTNLYGTLGASGATGTFTFSVNSGDTVGLAVSNGTIALDTGAATFKTADAESAATASISGDLSVFGSDIASFEITDGTSVTTTAELTITSAMNDLATITTAGGADKITISSGGSVSDDAKIDTGAGNDTIDLSKATLSGDITIKGGAGADTITIGKDVSGIVTIDVSASGDASGDTVSGLGSGDMITVSTGSVDWSTAAIKTESDALDGKSYKLACDDEADSYILYWQEENGKDQSIKLTGIEVDDGNELTVSGGTDSFTLNIGEHV